MNKASRREHLGSRIRVLRQEAGYDTASAFARLLGITPQSLINIERGNRGPSIDMLVRIADGLDKTVDDLLKDAA